MSLLKEGYFKKYTNFQIFDLFLRLYNALWIIADFSILTHSRISMSFLSYIKAAHGNRSCFILKITMSIFHKKNNTIFFLWFFIDKIRLQINFWGGGDSFTLPLIENIHLLVTSYFSKYESETVPPPFW